MKCHCYSKRDRFWISNPMHRKGQRPLSLTKAMPFWFCLPKHLFLIIRAVNCWELRMSDERSWFFFIMSTDIMAWLARLSIYLTALLIINKELCKIAFKHSPKFAYFFVTRKHLHRRRILESVFKRRRYFVSTDKSIQYTRRLINYIGDRVRRKPFLHPVCYCKRTFRCAHGLVDKSRERSTRNRTKKIILLGSDMMKLRTPLTLGIIFAIALVHSTVSFLEYNI